MKKRKRSDESGLVACATMTFTSPVGPITLAATPKGICRVLLRGSRPFEPPAGTVPAADAPPALRKALLRMRDQLGRYLAGERVTFDVPLDLSAGTPFERRVWRACGRIPYGEVRSYGQLAAMARCPRGARAVGGAMGANGLPLVVPCHRVVRSDGSLGGYGLGLPLKKRLLRQEGAL